MSYKTFELPSIGTLTIYKKRQSRSIRLTVMPNGSARITQPYWLPYKAGVTFATSRASWILDNRPNGAQALFYEGRRIGKAMTLHFERSPEADIRTRLRGNQLVIIVPRNHTPESPAVQAAAHKAALRALRREAERVLPLRLRFLAKEHGFSYHSVSVRQLKSRWGSCSHQQEITLNIFLLELPWELIDYVILHELTHTKHMHHQASFWSEFCHHLPNAKALKGAMKAHQPAFAVAQQ